MALRIRVPSIVIPVAGELGRVKVWNGSAWVAKPLKWWNGTSWVAKPVKYNNGTSWVTTGY